MLNISHKNKITKYIVYPISGFFAYVAFYFIKLFPFKMASNFGGFLARKIGPRFKEHKLAKKNMSLAFPLKTEKEIDLMLDKMWDNIGRVFLEFPSLDYLDTHPQNVKYIGDEPKNNKPRIYISAHYGNWEVISYVGHILKKDLGFVFRPPNNPYVRDLVNKRAKNYGQEPIEKGVLGMKTIVNFLKNKKDVAMLVDQRLMEGVKVDFFGRKAMATPAVARLALKYDAEVFSIFVKRENKHNFDVSSKRIDTDNIIGDNLDDKVLELTQKITKSVEDEITKNPEQWFWVHNRWKM
ncbi:MAG: lipid A biosynthesis lauroyl acyltransferase [Alphaproteobacteria bacterium ADurb.Bin438]|nr:MAG: lipid A biosynthesis lauroyl acyltransferase [Alphaproteobacteria bacterium ADurb.Bin438]